MSERKVSHIWQIRFAQEIVFADKRCIWIQNRELEVLLNKDNALDIIWVRYKGVNLSFLSKNGLNDGKRDFSGNFEGGFLYTCGMDNVSSCVPNKLVHGSFHYQKAINVYSYEKEGVIYVCGEVKDTALFGKNLVVKRCFAITENTLTISDTVINEGFKDAEYVLLYHINYGYPFLDECLEISIPAIQSDPLTEVAKARSADMFCVTAPIDENDEDVYYHTLAKGDINLYNPKKNIGLKMEYDVKDFPVTLEWKSMTSGDYALGIEPSLTRFDNFKMQTLKAKEQKAYQIKISMK